MGCVTNYIEDIFQSKAGDLDAKSLLIERL